MPFGDRTGPAGMGPRTGRGAGYCSGAGMPGSMNRAPGRGFGMGRGGGMGFGFRGSSPPWPYVGRGRGGRPRCGYFPGGGVAYASPPPDAEGELDFLKGQAREMKDELARIEERMHDLEGKA